MVLNGFTILGLCCCLMRLLLGTTVVGLSLYREKHLKDELANRSRDIRLLASMLALLLAGLVVVSWPLLYVTLQSYVRQWPGTMCIFGVLQVGAAPGSRLAWLPLVAQCVQWLKPAMVFAAGAWVVLAYLSHQTSRNNLGAAQLSALLLVGTLGVADASLEAVYLAAPKREASPSLGCCLVPLSSNHEAPGPLARALSDLEEKQFRLGFFGLSLAVAGGLLFLPRLGLTLLSRRSHIAILISAGLLEAMLLPVFLSRSVSPAVTHIEGNFCPYDVLPVSPAAVAGTVLIVTATLCIGWAVVALRSGTEGLRCPMTDRTVTAGLYRQLTSTSAICLACGLSSLAFALARC